MSKLWVASRPITDVFTEPYVGDFVGEAGEHLFYIVYDPDGDPTTGDELVWRSGPEILFPPMGNIEVENWVPIADSFNTF